MRVVCSIIADRLPNPYTRLYPRTTHTRAQMATAAATAAARRSPSLLLLRRPATSSSPSALLRRCSRSPASTNTSSSRSRSSRGIHSVSPGSGGWTEEPPRDLKDCKFALEGNGVAIITLERPQRLNALSEGMGESLLRLADYLAAAPADRVRACIVYGGTRAFSTGRDLKDSKLHTTLAQRERYMKLALDSVLAIGRLPVPTIAAIAGPAFGWGLELALACDLRVATRDATLCLPETSLGIFPGAGGAVMLREIVSPATAKELVFTARRFTGQEARELGVVNAAVGDAWHEAWSLAERIAGNGPLGVRGAKEVIDGCHNVDFTSAISLSSQLRAPLSETDDFMEALQAFEEKRKPVFKGR